MFIVITQMITSFVPALVKKTRFLQLHPSSARNGLISLDFEECGAQLGGSGKAKLFWRALRRGVDPLNEPDDVGLSAKARGTVAALLDGSALIPLEQGPLTTANCGTCKWMSTLVDGGQIETVLIPSGKFDRTTLCVSTQIGCDRGCRFCATGLMGIVRNLTASEIIGQVVHGIRISKEQSLPPLTNIVFMGMGDAGKNLDHVDTAVRCITDHMRLSFAQAKCTVSTVGPDPAVFQRIANMPSTMAWSLHAASDGNPLSLPLLPDRTDIDIAWSPTHMTRSIALHIRFLFCMRQTFANSLCRRPATPPSSFVLV
jgi:hypothetical protein